MRSFSTCLLALLVSTALADKETCADKDSTTLLQAQLKADISSEVQDFSLESEEETDLSLDEEEEVKPTDGEYGDKDCPCVGIDDIKGTTKVHLGKNETKDQAADVGASCKAWEDHWHPKCKGANAPKWCKQKWCYVDPCNCKKQKDVPKPSDYLPDARYQGKPLHYSYATCGGTDSWTSDKKRKALKHVKEVCAVKVDDKKWGKDDCRCVGIGPQPGTTKVTIDTKPGGLPSHVDFPASTGAFCNKWEEGKHPLCKGKNPPKWCHQAWCYVDPCKCKLATPPKTTSYLPKANWEGKPVYFSYATCGGEDHFSAGNKMACVNKKTKAQCALLAKCAWDGKACMGKEIVKTCHPKAAKKAEVHAAKKEAHAAAAKAVKALGKKSIKKEDVKAAVAKVAQKAAEHMAKKGVSHADVKKEVEKVTKAAIAHLAKKGVNTSHLKHLAKHLAKHAAAKAKKHVAKHEAAEKAEKAIKAVAKKGVDKEGVKKAVEKVVNEAAKHLAKKGLPHAEVKKEMEKVTKTAIKHLAKAGVDTKHVEKEAKQLAHAAAHKAKFEHAKAKAAHKAVHAIKELVRNAGKHVPEADLKKEMKKVSEETAKHLAKAGMSPHDVKKEVEKVTKKAMEHLEKKGVHHIKAVKKEAHKIVKEAKKVAKKVAVVKNGAVAPRIIAGLILSLGAFLQ